MKYSVRFTGTREECEAAALVACKEYVGKRFDRVIDAIKTTMTDAGSRTKAYRCCALALSFAGIEGYYPVRAMIREACKR